MSCTSVYSDESIEEVKNFLNSKACYVNTNGEFSYNVNTATIKFVLQTLTG
jgi:hypothetical protein